MTKQVKSLLHYKTNNSNSNEASPVILLRQPVSATRLIPLLFIVESTFLETFTAFSTTVTSVTGHQEVYLLTLTERKLIRIQLITWVINED